MFELDLDEDGTLLIRGDTLGSTWQFGDLGVDVLVQLVVRLGVVLDLGVDVLVELVVRLGGVADLGVDVLVQLVARLGGVVDLGLDVLVLARRVLDLVL